MTEDHVASSLIDRLRLRRLDVLSFRQGRRLIARVRLPDRSVAIVKWYAPAERESWRRHVITARALRHSGVTPGFLGHGATQDGGRWHLEEESGGVVPRDHAAADAQLAEVLPRGLGSLLARFHNAVLLTRRRFGRHGDAKFESLAEHMAARLQASLAAARAFHEHDPETARLLDEVSRLVPSWLTPFEAADRAGVPSAIVHGDYGTTNTIFSHDSGTWRPVAVIDLEDAGSGDAVEDFDWQALEVLIPGGDFRFGEMWDAYQAERRLDMGAGARLQAHAARLALDAGTWRDSDVQWRSDMLRALEQLVGGGDPLAGSQ